MGIFDQRTKLDNKMDLPIHFVADDGGICPLRDLPAGKSRSVSLSLIRKHCRERGSADWPIRVLINNQFYGMCLHPRHHILKMTRIVFRYEWRPDGSCTPIAEGVLENFRDRIFDCCVNNWDKKTYDEIARADSTWRSIREVGEAAAAPLIGTEQSRLSARWRKRLILASSTINGRIKRLKNGGGRRAAAASVMNSGRNSTMAAPAPVANSGQNSTMFIIFIIAFTFMAVVHIYMKL